MHFYKNRFLLIVLILVYACSSRDELFVPYSNSEITYIGRTDSTTFEGVQLFWSGTSIKLNFEGQSIAALLDDENGDNYYNVILDKDSLFILRADSIKRYHQLASNLSEGRHTIEIFRRTEWDRGTTTFYGFKIKGHAKVLAKSPPSKRKMEFYGNSITAGYAVEDLSGKDSPDGTNTNNYASYAAITARNFSADYHCICRSGIGIMVSWIPLIMPELYDRLNPKEPTSKWNFSVYQPNVVVVNLFQNDSWIVNHPDNEEFKKRFGDDPPDDVYIIKAYQDFIGLIREKYPETSIICSLGGMDAAKEGSKWIDYIKTAVTNLNDSAVYTHFMPYIEAKGHPSIQDQQKMAKSLSAFIEENINWN